MDANGYNEQIIILQTVSYTGQELSSLMQSSLNAATTLPTIFCHMQMRLLGQSTTRRQPSMLQCMLMSGHSLETLSHEGPSGAMKKPNTCYFM